MKKTIFSLLILAGMLVPTVTMATERTDVRASETTRMLYPRTKYVVPITGRKVTLYVSDADVLSLSKEQYTEYMKSAKKSTNTTKTAMVKRVGTNLANAVENYLKNHGYSSELSNYNWEFNLVQDQSANAFCMPGGKIVVYEGLLPITQNETALAIVLGHEIAHAVAKHSQEQLSTQKKQNVAGNVLSIGMAVFGVSDGLSSLASTAWNAGTTLFSLKYSRDDESEADHMGLIFAAMAGYDPSEAVTFWQRMASSSSSSTPAFLSDHPSDEKRISNVKGWVPEAQTYYKAAKKTTTTTKKKK